MSRGSKLSPIPYLLHNKRRTSVLVVSLSLFFVLIYVLGYFMGVIGEPIQTIFMEKYKRVYEVHTYIDNDTLGEYETTEEWDVLVRPILYERQEELQKLVGDSEVFLVRGGYTSLHLIAGSIGMSTTYFENVTDMNRFSEIIDAKLVEGRWPENPGELVVDTNSYINVGDDILKFLSADYKIVGKVESPAYVVYGLPAEVEHNYYYLVTTSEDKKVDEKYFKDNGFECTVENYDSIYERTKKDIDNLDDIKQLVTAVAGILLAVCVAVVFALHIRDRREEWCLFESIGFTSGQIYFMALEEILICFVIAIGIGLIISGAAVVVLDKFIVYPMGLGHIQMIRPKDALLALEMFAIVLAVCQVPVFFTIRSVQTVDNIEE